MGLDARTGAPPTAPGVKGAPGETLSNAVQSAKVGGGPTASATHLFYLSTCARIRLPEGTRPGFEVETEARGEALKTLGTAFMAATVDAPRATWTLRDPAAASSAEFPRFEAPAVEL